MIDKHQLKRIQLANQQPINQAAMAFLPKTWQGTDEIAVLALMRWGMDNGVTMAPLAADHPDNNQLLIQLSLMASWKPANALGFLLNPEQEQDGSVALEAETLAAEPTAEDAAGLLLQTLYEAMVATAP
ncbi:hypothetical protein [Collimonas sp. OK412]|uniref:hypothetical protein n=1 Tax=Collimonas sp. (strain OK412) TaxID=1801619 RepID=UPI0015876D77|nr:hypothetical protein [Collimonas sp. OK412]